jgi:hypothetical protein
MTPNRRPLLYDSFAIAAIICSTVSLFALLELGATRWTTSLNILSLVLILFAVRTRPRLPRQR